MHARPLCFYREPELMSRVRHPLRFNMKKDDRLAEQSQEMLLNQVNHKEVVASGK
jgi:hypothetical protein